VTKIHESYADLFDSDSSAKLHRLLVQLDHVFGTAEFPSMAEDRVLAAIYRPGVSPARQVYRPRLQRLFGALIAASILLLGGGMVVSLRGSSPTPVSAQSILERAAALQVPANRALHLVYRVTLSGHAATVGRYGIWVEFGAHGGIVREGSTDVESADGITSSITRCVGQKGVTRCYRYEPTSRYLRNFNVTNAQNSKEARRFLGPLSGIDFLTGVGLSKILRNLLHYSPPGVLLLPERPFHGLSVYPIRVRIARGTAAPQLTLTFYFDSHSYILRGISVLPPQGPGSADVVTQNFVLARRSTVPLSAVPPLTFMFQPPRVSV
jgi:hypothetical protein